MQTLSSPSVSLTWSVGSTWYGISRRNSQMLTYLWASIGYGCFVSTEPTGAAVVGLQLTRFKYWTHTHTHTHVPIDHAVKRRTHSLDKHRCIQKKNTCMCSFFVYMCSDDSAWRVTRLFYTLLHIDVHKIWGNVPVPYLGLSQFVQMAKQNMNVQKKIWHHLRMLGGTYK